MVAFMNTVLCYFYFCTELESEIILKLEVILSLEIRMTEIKAKVVLQCNFKIFGPCQ